MKPVLVIMAAGLGSRYGGLKQIDKIGPNGEIILELSAYDAIKSGFEEIVFIVREEILSEFKELIGNKLEKVVDIKYVIQDISKLPKGFNVPQGRTKPWGTGHAILCAKDVVKTPFMVINSDDYYGEESFKLMYDFLKNNNDNNEYGMVSYKLGNTLSEYGYVARGICDVNDNYLSKVIERTKIIKKDGKAFFTEDETEFIELDLNKLVSMNMWGFMPGIFESLEEEFNKFLLNDVSYNPLKSEFYIPKVVGNLISENKVKVRVMSSNDKWYGVTYQEDKKLVKDAIDKMIKNGVYPNNLWGNMK